MSRIRRNRDTHQRHRNPHWRRRGGRSGNGHDERLGRVDGVRADPQLHLFPHGADDGARIEIIEPDESSLPPQSPRLAIANVRRVLRLTLNLQRYLDGTLDPDIARPGLPAELRIIARTIAGEFSA